MHLAKGMTDENIAFGEPEGKKKASGSQRTEGMTEEKKKEERPRCGCTGVP